MYIILYIYIYIYIYIYCRNTEGKLFLYVCDISLFN